MSGGSRPSGSRFSRSVPPAVERAVRAGEELNQEERQRVKAELLKAAGSGGNVPSGLDRLEAGLVPGGMPALQERLRHDSARATRNVVGQAEELGLMRRVGWSNGQTGSRLLFVVEQRLISSAGCTNCGAPIAPKSTYCQKCSPSFRSDRAWRITALEMLVAGRSLPAIATAVGQLLYPARGDSPVAGVVAYLLGELPELVPTEWREGYRTVMGAEFEDLAGRVTGRARQRRWKRKRAGDGQEGSN